MHARTTYLSTMHLLIVATLISVTGCSDAATAPLQRTLDAPSYNRTGARHDTSSSIDEASGAALHHDTAAAPAGTPEAPGTADSITQQVASPFPTLISDFRRGTIAPFTNPWGRGIDVIDDPTGSGRGKVVRLQYGVRGKQSTELALAATSAPLRYGQTMWMRGDVYLPATGTAANAGDNRKLLDFQGGGVRMTLHRVGANDLRVSIVDWMSGTERESIAESSGLTIPNDRWTTIEVKMVTNSADNVRDGVLEIYLDRSPTPSYRRASGLGWITEKFVGPYGRGSYFNSYLIGFQITNSTSKDYSEDRYWDNVSVSGSRLP